MIPNAVTNWLRENGYGKVVAENPVGGGCINNGARLQTESRASFFLKTNRHGPPDMFACEAEGLGELRKAIDPRLPEPLLWAEKFILLEDLRPEKRSSDYWETLARQLASLHLNTRSKFGFDNDNYLGSTRQPNQRTEDGYEFFNEQRLGFQTRLARDHNLLTRGEAAEISRLANRLRQLVPPQPASLIHGDLCGGNAITDERGQPAIIDPAAHYGWAEAELAMTALFGGFPPAFYSAYVEARTLDIGWADRLPIYNLYQLLNHLNLFGAGYHGQIMEIVRHFS